VFQSCRIKTVVFIEDFFDNTPTLVETFLLWQCYEESAEVFELARNETERRKSGKSRHSGTGLYSSKIKCGCCGSWYGSIVWHNSSKYKRTIYQCNHKFGEKCTTPHLTEEQIQTAFISAANKLITDKDSIISDFRLLEKQHGLIIEFDSGLWCSLVDFASVRTDGKIEFTFRNGAIIEA
jgi:hypothetical protein